MRKSGNHISILSPQLLEYNIVSRMKKELEDIDEQRFKKIEQVIHNIIFSSVEDIEWEQVTKE